MVATSYGEHRAVVISRKIEFVFLGLGLDSADHDSTQNKLNVLRGLLERDRIANLDNFAQTELSKAFDISEHVAPPAFGQKPEDIHHFAQLGGLVAQEERDSTVKTEPHSPDLDSGVATPYVEICRRALNAAQKAAQTQPVPFVSISTPPPSPVSQCSRLAGAERSDGADCEVLEAPLDDADDGDNWQVASRNRSSRLLSVGRKLGSASDTVEELLKARVEGAQAVTARRLAAAVRIQAFVRTRVVRIPDEEPDADSTDEGVPNKREPKKKSKSEKRRIAAQKSADDELALRIAQQEADRIRAANPHYALAEEVADLLQRHPTPVTCPEGHRVTACVGLPGWRCQHEACGEDLHGCVVIRCKLGERCEACFAVCTSRAECGGKQWLDKAKGDAAAAHFKGDAAAAQNERGYAEAAQGPVHQ